MIHVKKIGTYKNMFPVRNVNYIYPFRKERDFLIVYKDKLTFFKKARVIHVNPDFTLDSREFQKHARFTWIFKIRVIHVSLKSR